jgi:hypothetical protein
MASGTWIVPLLALAAGLPGIAAAEGKLFQCGSYLVRGKVRLPADARVAPTLVLWERTLSETAIPVRMDAKLRDRLSAMGQPAVQGEFEVRIPAKGRWPHRATVLAFRFPSPRELASPPEAKLLRAEACEDAR